MGIKIDLFFVRDSELTWFLCRVEHDVVLVFGLKLTWFMWGIKIDLLSV